MKSQSQRAVIGGAAQAATASRSAAESLPFLHQPLEAASDGVAPFRHALLVHVEHYD